MGAVNVSKIDVAKLPIFSGEKDKAHAFISTCEIYIQIRMEDKRERTKITWVLSYVQGGMAEDWKENLLAQMKEEDGGSEIVRGLFRRI